MRELRSNRIFFLKADHICCFYLNILTKSHDPAQILRFYRAYSKKVEYLDQRVLITAIVQLGKIYCPNSFWSTADRQVLCSNPLFKCLVSDLTLNEKKISGKDALRLVFSFANLEYRPAKILKLLASNLEKEIVDFSYDALALLAYSIASLNFNSDLLKLVIRTAYARNSSNSYLHGILAYAAMITGIYELDEIPVVASFLLRAGLANAVPCGWFGFHLYSILYAADVERPESVELIKQALPFELQEHLHNNWLNKYVLNGQPVGKDLLQLEVANILEDNQIPFLLNSSIGRAEDEQHVLFAHFLFPEKNAILFCDSYLPPGSYLSSPLLALGGHNAFKARICRKIGFSVGLLHLHEWKKLKTQESKEQQVLLLMQEIGQKKKADCKIRIPRGQRFQPSVLWTPDNKE